MIKISRLLLNHILKYSLQLKEKQIFKSQKFRSRIFKITLQFFFITEVNIIHLVMEFFPKWDYSMWLELSRIFKSKCKRKYEAIIVIELPAGN